MASRWNQMTDGLARTPLPQHPSRVLHAIMRKTLGWSKTADRISLSQLVDETGLNRRNVQAALDWLVRAKIIQREAEGPGKSSALITLNLDWSTWDVPKARGDATSKGASMCAFPTTSKGASPRTLKARLDAPTRGKGKEQATEATLTDRVFEAYLTPAGAFPKPEYRRILAGQTKTLEREKVEPRFVIAAAAQLGKERGFTGDLGRRAKEIADKGGVCMWEGLRRSRLTVAQLEACSCLPCQSRAEKAPAEATSGTKQQAA
jgi:phage replication O-like protein O